MKKSDRGTLCEELKWMCNLFEIDGQKRSLKMSSIFQSPWNNMFCSVNYSAVYFKATYDNRSCSYRKDKLRDANPAWVQHLV